MEKQTIAWCATIPNSRKNISKMRMVFDGPYVKFVPNFEKDVKGSPKK